MKTIALTAALVALADPALAHQTEVDFKTMEWKRAGLARWDRKMARLERRAYEQVAPEETSAPNPVISGHTGGVLTASQVASYARGAGFPEDVIPTMVEIAWGESRFDPSAVNSSSGACGLWQMYPCPGPEALNPATNAAMAYAKYAASGLAPWGYG
jgi:hypothetical protein